VLVSIVRISIKLLHNHKFVNVLLDNFETAKISWDEGNGTTVNTFTDTVALHCLFRNSIDRNHGIHEMENISNLYCFTTNCMLCAGTIQQSPNPNH
jgi:hypothetical protein